MGFVLKTAKVWTKINVQKKSLIAISKYTKE